MKIARKTVFQVFNRMMQKNSNFVFRRILSTPPIRTEPQSDAVLYSLLDRSSCCAYLLAAKSFLQYCPPMCIVVQSDGSIDDRWRRVLEFHLPGISFLHDSETKHYLKEHCSKAILACLPPLEECHFFLVHKFLAVLARFKEKRVVLLDSDLLFLREPSFVVDWIRNRAINTAFHSDGGNSLTKAFSEMGFNTPKVPLSEFNAGFIGFFNKFSDDVLCSILHKVRSYDQSLFGNWEVEQSLWAILFNEIEQTVNLDNLAHDYVASGYWSYDRIQHSVLAHFIGSVRFKNLTYPRLAHAVIKQLKSYFDNLSGNGECPGKNC